MPRILEQLDDRHYRFSDGRRVWGENITDAIMRHERICSTFMGAFSQRPPCPADKEKGKEVKFVKLKITGETAQAIQDYRETCRKIVSLKEDNRRMNENVKANNDQIEELEVLAHRLQVQVDGHIRQRGYDFNVIDPHG